MVERPRRPSGSGRLVVAGVMGACALGTGLGMWARPTSPNAAPATIAPQAPSPPRPSLQIVVDDAAAPIGRPMEVLPADLAPAEEPTPTPEMVAPRRSASGLVKVDTTIAPEPLLAPAARAEPQPAPKTEPRPDADIASAKLAKARLEATRLEKARIESARAEAAKIERAKLEKAKAEKARLEASRTQHAKADRTRADKARAEQARIAEAKARKARQLADARAEAADRAHAQKLAQAEKARVAKLEAKREASAKARKLAALAQAASRKLEAEAKALSHRKAVQVAEAKAKTAKLPPRTLVAVRKSAPRGEGPMRVARANTCASPDPGEAMVCADRRLGDRDRQMQQAYRNAEAAGVPASALNRQQARWLQARAAAAREAPWAVEDVYVARISELNDLSRDAREN